MDAVQLTSETVSLPISTTNPRLHQYVVYDSAQRVQSSRNWHRIWSVAEVAQIVAFVIIGAIVIQTFHPLISLAAILYFTPKCKDIVDSIDNKVVFYANSVVIAESHLMRTREIKDSDVTKRLTDLGISKKQIENLNHAYPTGAKELLARYDEMSFRAKFLEEKMNQSRETVDSILGKTDYLSKGYQNLLKTAKGQGTSNALIKLEMAYILKIMTNPHENKKRTDYIALEKVTGPNLPEDAGFIYKTPSGKEYRIGDIRNVTVRQLAEDIFEVPKKGLLSSMI